MNYQTITKTVTLNYYHTPSHGYVQIHKNLVNEVATCKALQSQYSFYDTCKALQSQYSFYNAKLGLFYFEEDCDASEVLTALKNVGYEINFVDRHDDLETIKTYKRLG